VQAISEPEPASESEPEDWLGTYELAPHAKATQLSATELQLDEGNVLAQGPLTVRVDDRRIYVEGRAWVARDPSSLPAPVERIAGMPFAVVVLEGRALTEGATFLPIATPKEKPTSRELRPLLDALVRLCEHGSTTSECVRAGAEARFEDDLTPDPALASLSLRMYAKACERRDPRGCAGYGRALFVGHGVARDLGQGRKLLEDACKAEPLECWDLGFTLSRRGDAQDLPGALEAYQKACLSRYPLSCKAAGDLLLRDGVVHDAVSGIAHLETACDLGEKYACFDLSNEYRRGKNVSANTQKAAQLRDKACKLGNKRACEPP
jgi:TPR repeat protein